MPAAINNVTVPGSGTFTVTYPVHGASPRRRGCGTGRIAKLPEYVVGLKGAVDRLLAVVLNDDVIVQRVVDALAGEKVTHNGHRMASAICTPVLASLRGSLQGP